MNAKLDKAIEDTTAALADGLDASDLATLIRSGIEVAESMDGIKGEEKAAVVLAFAEDLIEKFWDTATPAMAAAIKAIDIPYIPEGIEDTVIDPLLEKAAPPILKHFVKLALPSLVKLVVDASRGGVQVNTAPWVKAATAIEFISTHGEMLKVALELQDDGAGSDGRAALDALTEAMFPASLEI